MTLRERAAALVASARTCDHGMPACPICLEALVLAALETLKADCAKAATEGFLPFGEDDADDLDTLIGKTRKYVAAKIMALP